MAATRSDLIKAFVPESPFASYLGMRLERLEPDVSEVVLPYRQEMATMGDVVHGGAQSALIDMAATAAAWDSDEEPQSAKGATVDIAVQYVAAARGQDLTASARVRRRGRRLCFISVDVTEPDGRLVA